MTRVAILLFTLTIAACQPAQRSGDGFYVGGGGGIDRSERAR